MVEHASARRSISESVRIEQIRVLFRQMPMVLTTNLISAVVCVVVLAGVVPQARLFGWASLTVLLTGARFALWWLYRHEHWPQENQEFWARLVTGSAALSGTLWGVGSVVVFPDPLLERMFLAFVIGGMCAGAVSAHSTHFPTAFAFVATACLPLAVRFFAEGSLTYAAMAAMILVFVVGLSLVAWNTYRSFAALQRLRFELTSRTEELCAANIRLREEEEQRRSAQDALRHAQKMEALGQLTGGIAHDFNNVLTVVAGNLDRARARIAGGDGALVKLVDNALRAAERAERLTRQLLAFARKQKLAPQLLDLRAVMETMGDMLRRTVGERIAIRTSAPPDLWRARVDLNQFEMALLNLAINARDAMPSGGAIDIRFANVELTAEVVPPGVEPGSYVAVAMSDTGVGIPADMLDRVFEPFFTTKPAGSGSGLGLSQVHGFVHQSGGFVRAESVLGSGTTITLFLPKASGAAEDEIAEGSLPAASGSGERILLVEDDPLVRDFAASTLHELGYRVIEAEDGEAAMRILESGTEVDLVFSDVVMPGKVSGVDLARLVRTNHPRARVLLTSGYSERLSPEDLGPDIAFLPKPYLVGALAARVRDVIGRAPAR